MFDSIEIRFLMEIPYGALRPPMPLRGKQGRTCAVKGAGRGALLRVACGAGGPVNVT